MLCNGLVYKLKENYIRSALNQGRNDCNLYVMFLGEKHDDVEGTVPRRQERHIYSSSTGPRHNIFIRKGYLLSLHNCLVS